MNRIYMYVGTLIIYWEILLNIQLLYTILYKTVQKLANFIVIYLLYLFD